MAAPNVLRFGSCEVHVHQREVRLDGHAREIAPKAFDLLLMLVNERHRVVSKAELAETLWQHQEVSDSVLARTVMKVRQAIGDSAAQPVWIKTVHGYGYRFVGEVFESLAEGPAPVSMPAQAGGRTRVGVLPCENQTGDHSFDWTQFGLMALVGHGLEADDRLEVVPMQTMLEALGRLPRDAVVLDKVQLALDALGVTWVVWARLRRQGVELWLDYELSQAGSAPRCGSLCERDLVVMGQRFAQAISSAMFPGNGVDVEFECDDPFVNQAFSRGIELFNQQRVQSAAKLFDLVRELQPFSLAPRLWCLQVQVSLGEPEAEPAADMLLEQARQRGDARVQAMTHLLLGRMKLGLRCDAEGALAHFSQAEELAKGLGCADLRATVHHYFGLAEIASHRLHDARSRFTLAEAAFSASGNSLHVGHLNMQIAMIEECEGNLFRAQQRMKDAVSQMKAHRLRGYATVGTARLASMNATLGTLDRAHKEAEEVLTDLEALEHPEHVAICSDALARVLCESGDVKGLERLTSIAERLTSGGFDPRVLGPKAVALAHLALWRGDLTGLRGIVDRAVAARPQQAEPLLMLYWLHLRALSAARCFDETASVRERIRSHPISAFHVESRAAVTRSLAAEHHAWGDHEAALSMLNTLICQTSFGREHARARIDAAWLLAELGQPGTA
ncbi:MAG TPA: winged helix-turn-helix domain-containing protein, partial [Burkholderiaceae bacterium]|nr:winged helix-turn-helix domain-containing protein [Burkholderiaceae bacterium]